VDRSGGDVQRVARRNGVLLVTESDGVLAFQDVLFVFDVVGVFRHLGAGFEDEAPQREVRRAMFGADEDALRKALGGRDGFVLDVVVAADQRSVGFGFRFGHTRGYEPGEYEPVGQSFNRFADPQTPMKNFRVGSAFGIPIKLDLTFLLILPVFAYLIGIQLESLVDLLNVQFTVEFDAAVLAASAVTRFGIGLAAALGLFFCVVLHEFGHSLVARRYGVHIDSITLWLLGGIAQMQEIPEDWKQEFNIAIAGPIVSVLAGMGSYFAFRIVPDGGFLLEAAQFTLAYLAIMNIVLAVFNMLPGFPMDGGRILRALLARNRPHAQATQQAARVGQLFAILLGLFGLLINFNPLLIVLAFFIYIAAASESTRTVMNAAFEGVTVSDVMTPRDRLDVVSPKTTVAELVERMFRERHTGYPVMEGDRVAGVVTLDDAREIDSVERDAYRVEDIMSHDIHAVEPDVSVMDAFETMQQNGVGRLLVIEGETDEATGRLIGLLSRTDVMTALDIVKSGGSPSRRSVDGDARAAETLDRERI